MANAVQRHEPTRSAWTQFWADSAQSRCVSGDPQIWQALESHWTRVARLLPARTRVVDLGCGAGAVGRLLLAARVDLDIVGVDSARVPRSTDARMDLRSDARMEALPFADQGFGAVVSQFGFEYGDVDATTREIARVLAPRGRVSLLVHHAGSAIVCASRARLSALRTFLAPSLRAAFCAGEGEGLHAQVSALLQAHPDDPLVDDLARTLPPRLAWDRQGRVATWAALADALAPEVCVCESLQACCIDAARLDEWLEPLRAVCNLSVVEALNEPDGTPIAWCIDGLRRA